MRQPDAARRRAMPRYCGLVSSAVAVCAAFTASAQEVYRIPMPDRGQQLATGLGGGFRTGTSIYRDETAFLDLLPLYMVDSRFLFVEGNAGGVHLGRGERWTLDVLARYRFDLFEPDVNQSGNENLRTRERTIDAGVAAQYRADWGELRAVWVRDVQSRHRGQEVELTYRRAIERGRWHLVPYVTLSWLDEDLTNYYFGVSPDEAAPGTPVYRPDEALNASLGLNARYRLTDRIFLQGNLAAKFYDGTISDSPIVTDSEDVTAFVGAGYVFDGPFDSSERDTLRGGRGLWTYRVNYAYAAAENIFPLGMAGFWKQNEEAQTDLLGLTVGRLMQSGKRVDVYARLGGFRHFENGLQDDTWSFAASIMLMGRGYLPWSDKAAFRWGFGWGVSYSVDVLALERIKQENRGDKNNRFLGYLDWQVDVPIDLLFESELTRDCYVGVSVVHRSGIWGYAQLFNDVSGGSDFVGVHVECVR